MTAAHRRSDPRARALAVLCEVFEADVFGAARLAELQEGHPLSAADSGLAMELVLGTTRHRITCEHIAAHFFRGRWAGLHEVIRLNMAMAVYQLCWLDRVPDHAIVDSAVRLASSHGRGTASRINAILRSVAASRGPMVDLNESSSEPPDQTGDGATAKRGAVPPLPPGEGRGEGAVPPLPLGEGRGEGSTPGASSPPSPRRWLPIDATRGRLFDCDLFPDPARRPLEYLVAITSHTPFFVERWHRRFKPKRCRQVLDAGQRRPSLVLRPNAMRITPQALLERLREAKEPRASAPPVRGISIPGEQVDSSSPDRHVGQASVERYDVRLVNSHIVLEGVSSPADLDVFHEGLCQPQDSTAGIALTLAPPMPGEFVLDLCAGSGTKSTQAAEMMGDRGRVLATDADALRLGRIAENAARLGLTIVEAVPLNDLDAALAAGKAPDLILIDAPCSNTGVLARRPEARYRATHKSIASLVEIQRGLLARAVALSGPKTRLIYSTCSIEPEENESQIAAFLAANPGWQLAESKFTLPDADRDGGYAAVMRRMAND